MALDFRVVVGLLAYRGCMLLTTEGTEFLALWITDNPA